VSFECPRCGMVSHHPTDEAEGYCGLCHDFTRTTYTVTELTADEMVHAEARYARAKHALYQLVGYVADHMDERPDEPCPGWCIGAQAPSWVEGLSETSVRMVLLVALRELGEMEMDARHQ
jgi:hypothetical protein